jgi:hypothetical protein
MELESFLIVVVFHDDRLQIFCFDDHTAVEAFDIVDTVAPGNDNSTVMLTNGRNGLRGLHKADYGFILTMSLHLSSTKFTLFARISGGRQTKFENCARHIPTRLA